MCFNPIYLNARAILTIHDRSFDPHDTGMSGRLPHANYFAYR